MKSLQILKCRKVKLVCLTHLIYLLFVSKELPDLMNNQVVVDIAERYSKTAAQVLLRHTVQRGIAVIPKSTNEGRIRENIEVKLDQIICLNSTWFCFKYLVQPL